MRPTLHRSALRRPPLPWKRVRLLGITLLMTACMRATGAWEYLSSADERMARTVTIHRDEWGIPHIYGPTDASVVFGMAYAMAEDNFWQIEDATVRALGRAAELYGESALAADIVAAGFEVQRLSREEYEREPPEMRRIWDAFAAGLNYYMRRHPEVQPRLIRRFEPWHAFTRFRSITPGTMIDGVRIGDVAAAPVDSLTGESDWQELGRWDVTVEDDPIHDEPSGSNTWAVAPARTSAGHALLFQNPHVSFFGGGQRYEVHVQSAEGWHFSGFAILGTPMPRAGHNERLGWSHTNSAADVQDAFELTFDQSDDPLAYRYGAEWGRAIEWEDTLLVRTGAILEPRRFRFRRTHYGPIVARRDGKQIAVRIARFAEGGSLQQWYAMGRATNLDEFRAALGRTALPISNTLYADRNGNIFYVHGNAVPRRGPGVDPAKILDGANPAHDWQGYHTLAELPQILNPPSGWIQNTNSTPFLATAEGDNPRRQDFPTYMAPEADNGRARASRRILAGRNDWSFDDWANAAFDTYVIEAEDHIATIVDDWERLGADDPERALKLDTAIQTLREWDHVGTTSSAPMSLFVLWLERIRQPGTDTAKFARIAALEAVAQKLHENWGSSLVPWGEINRLQRIHTSGQGDFDDNAASLPVAGAPGWAGIVFNFYTRPGPGGKRRYGTSGHTWVSVVEFGPRTRTKSVVTFGQSADPASPHYFDQAPLYAEGRLRDAWFWRDDVERNARRTYRPGAESQAPVRQ